MELASGLVAADVGSEATAGAIVLIGEVTSDSLGKPITEAGLVEVVLSIMSDS